MFVGTNKETDGVHKPVLEKLAVKLQFDKKQSKENPNSNCYVFV